VGYVFPLVILVAAISGAASLAGQERPLPDEDALFRDARENIARATRLQSGYAYKERRTELHMNPFGRLGTGGTLLYDVTPTEDGAVTMRTLLERDGKAVRGPLPSGRSAAPARNAAPEWTTRWRRCDSPSTAATA